MKKFYADRKYVSNDLNYRLAIGFFLRTGEQSPLHRTSIILSRDSSWSFLMSSFLTEVRRFLSMKSPSFSLLRPERKSTPLNILLLVLKEKMTRSRDSSRNLSFLY